MKITDSKSLGQAIRVRRKELNYTQAYLSGFTGLQGFQRRVKFMFPRDVWKHIRQQKTGAHMQSIW